MAPAGLTRPSRGDDGGVSPSDRIRVLIVDDHYMVREGLKVSLSTCDDIEVVGDAANGAEAVDLSRATRPDVVIMDVVMPVMDGPTATVRIREVSPETQVVALTSFVDEELVARTIEAGAISYLLKDSRPEALVQAVRDAALGRGSVDGGAMQALMRRGKDGVGHDLTKREREVLALLAAGLSNNEIAERLTLSVGTVRLHVSNILTKLEAPNRTSAAILAMKHGLV
jgi:NarL family two-component system response regulator LiaR